MQAHVCLWRLRAAASLSLVLPAPPPPVKPKRAEVRWQLQGVRLQPKFYLPAGICFDGAFQWPSCAFSSAVISRFRRFPDQNKRATGEKRKWIYRKWSAGPLGLGTLRLKSSNCLYRAVIGQLTNDLIVSNGHCKPFSSRGQCITNLLQQFSCKVLW